VNAPALERGQQRTVHRTGYRSSLDGVRVGSPVVHTVDIHPPLPHPAVIQIIAVGLAAGLLGGLFGVGGGLIIVPGLMALGFERKLAHGTSLTAFLPIVCASVITYLAHGHVDWPVALFLSIGSIAGAILGTRLLDVIPKQTLTIVFVVAIVLTATRLLLDPETVGRADLTIGDAIFLVAVGLIAGTLAGLLGIGGGIITVPAMMVGLGMIAVVAKGTSAAVIIPTAIMGTFRNRKTANVDVRTAAIVGLAGVPTAIAGGIIAGHLGDTVSNISFAVLLLVVAAIQLRTLREPTEPMRIPEQAFE
jgi:uncharacterized protein